MAAYVNRTISYMSGDAQYKTPVTGIHLKDSSPLQIFVNAKWKINDIFVEIEDYVGDSINFVKTIKDNEGLILPQECSNVENYAAKVKGIREVLARDHMKVVFFGRTSNGKSSVINAMLRDKILPSGIGHTTNCFLQVEGSDTGKSYLVTEDSEEKRDVKSVAQLANALCEEKLSESTLVKIFWPRDKCLLLRDDVVFVDSPGIDVTPNLDEWIDKHCLDADVFVLVANAESTLMVTEKNFFHKVSQKLSKPNIFILNNRWDASASEMEFLDQVRAQHLERAVDFLVKELRLCSGKEAGERVFFVSAKEVLQARLQEQSGLPPHSGALAEGFQARYFEFQDFERKFEECISKSAVKTKFAQHLQGGKLISHDVYSVMEATYERCQMLKADKCKIKKEIHDKLNLTEQQLILITHEMKSKIKHMVEEVEEKVSKALSDEIRRLSVLVDEFDTPFHPEPLVLNVYKKELHHHVEKGLGSNLRSRLSSALAMNIESSQREMIEKMSKLLPKHNADISGIAKPRREPFEVLYRLNCDNLCADFVEDLEFRFSWGIVALIQRFAGSGSNKIAVRNQHQAVPHTPLDSAPHQALTPSLPLMTSEHWSITSKLLMSSVGSQGTMGGLLVAGFMLKTVGWRLIMVTGAVYSCLYLYEWLTWSNKAKEREFKSQYVAHASKKLKMIVDLTSSNCSHQVEQELSSTFARLCQLVDRATDDMHEDIKQLDSHLKQVEEASNNAKVLRNKAHYLIKELDMFQEAYLVNMS